MYHESRKNGSDSSHRRSRASETPLYYDEWSVNWPGGANSQDSVKRVAVCRPLEHLIDRKKQPLHDVFISFLRDLLQVYPEKRLTADEALRHEFFKVAVSAKDE